MTAEAPPSPVPADAPLTADLVARALVFACAHYAVDIRTVYERKGDGRGRARLLAAALLADKAFRPGASCARVMAVNAVTLAPTQMAARRIFPEVVASVKARVFSAEPEPSLSPRALEVLKAAEPAKPEPLVLPKDPKRGEAGWIHPHRDMEREARVVKARKAGRAPSQIAEDEKVSKGHINVILRRSGETFAPIKSGRRPSGDKPVRKPKAATKPAAKPKLPVVAKVEAPRPVPMVAVEPFPDDHPAWAPLAGSTPVRLVDHTHGCRWPLTVEGHREPMVCNLRTVADHVYCERHRWLSVAPSLRAGLTRPRHVAAPTAADTSPHVAAEAA